MAHLPVKEIISLVLSLAWLAAAGKIPGHAAQDPGLGKGVGSLNLIGNLAERMKKAKSCNHTVGLETVAPSVAFRKQRHAASRHALSNRRARSV